MLMHIVNRYRCSPRHSNSLSCHFWGMSSDVMDGDKSNLEMSDLYVSFEFLTRGGPQVDWEGDPR